MLRGIYAPTDFVSTDKDPSLSPGEKIEIINASPVLVRPLKVRGSVREDSFIVTLPFVDGGVFFDNLPGSPGVLYSDKINVGDAALYGQGIGSRLLRAAIRHSVERNPETSEFHTGWARLGLVNTAVSVLGEGNVGVDRADKRYGWGSDRRLDAVFDDFPHTPGQKYLVNGIISKIDRDVTTAFEHPVYVAPE